jgi:choice-of-anchor B domain-containing protein
MHKVITLLSVCIFISFTGLSQSQNIILLDNWDNDTLPLDPYNSTFNECWGFVYNNQEYAVMGSTVGTHIFKITATNQLEEIQFLPGNIDWAIHRDYHDYNNILYGVSDEEPGLDIMDMSTLPDSLTRTRNTVQFNNTHNIFIDSATATMYCCDASMTDIFTIAGPDSLIPKAPYGLPSFDYVHDIYARRDTLFMNSSLYGLCYIDMGAPAPVINSLEFYPDKGYNHSGWLSDDGLVYVFADETAGKSVKVCDASDWSDIQVTAQIMPSTFDSTMAHNLMLKDNLLFISYYYDGLQVYDISDIYNPVRVAYYDTYQGPDSTVFEGAWGVYCYLPSGRILVSDRHNGLFLLEMDIPSSITNLNSEDLKIETHPNKFVLNFTNYDEKLIRVFSQSGQLIFEKTTTDQAFSIDNSSWSAGTYIYQITGEQFGINGKLIKADN